jgi:hypothetical protein
MTEVFNGPNGKYAIIAFSVLGIGVLVLCGYGIHHGYSPSVSYGNAQLALSKI